jgi:hypothetical protein
MLTTLDRLKSELTITGTDDDTLLTSIIVEKSAEIQTYCSRSFASVGATETYRPGMCRKRLVLRRQPVSEVHSITVNGVVLDSGDFEIEDAAAGFLLRVDQNGCSIGWPPGRIDVTYTAGFIAVPADVERCVLDLCVRAWFARGRDPALRSEKILDVIDSSWTASDSAATKGGLPRDVAERLDAYRMVRI